MQRAAAAAIRATRAEPALLRRGSRGGSWRLSSAKATAAVVAVAVAVVQKSHCARPCGAGKLANSEKDELAAEELGCFLESRAAFEAFPLYPRAFIKL